MAKSSSTWTTVFGVLGFVLGGVIGALIGSAAGFILDNSINALPESEGSNPDTDRAHTHRRATVGDLRVSLIVLIACVIKADGRVLKTEVNHIKPFLLRNYGEEGAKQALQLLRQLLDKDIDPDAVTAQIRQNVNYSTRLEILHMLVDLARSDGEFHPAEQLILDRIAQGLGIHDADYRSVDAATHPQADPHWAYTVLEITPEATNDEVKHAYRRMAMKYHPDKLSAAGEEMQATAAEKFRRVKEAYDHIKLQRGIA
ncbi:MAG: TerB family tellurite resistance protein [Paludibacteraceae bacterium]|nr:TerB family tellurite resistance protein [Paludibacteraceae bacterium]